MRTFNTAALVGCAGVPRIVQPWNRMTSGSSAILKGVYFVDELRRWAVDLENTILATTHSDTTWSQQTPDTPANTGSQAVFFTSATNG